MSWSVQSDPFGDFDIPEALQESLQRHRQHLAKLIMDLKSAGLSETQIETSVCVIVESYKQELLRAIKALVR